MCFLMLNDTLIRTYQLLLSDIVSDSVVKNQQDKCFIFDTQYVSLKSGDQGQKQIKNSRPRDLKRQQSK
jgi:hypothetical protein